MSVLNSIMSVLNIFPLDTQLFIRYNNFTVSVK